MKSPISALGFIPRHYGVPASTPHFSGFACIDLGAFYEAIRNETFYPFFNDGCPVDSNTVVQSLPSGLTCFRLPAVASMGK